MLWWCGIRLSTCWRTSYRLLLLRNLGRPDTSGLVVLAWSGRIGGRHRHRLLMLVLVLVLVLLGHRHLVLDGLTGLSVRGLELVEDGLSGQHGYIHLERKARRNCSVQRKKRLKIQTTRNENLGKKKARRFPSKCSELLCTVICAL